MVRVDKIPSLYPLQTEEKNTKIIPCLIPAMNQTVSLIDSIPLHLPPDFPEFLRAQKVMQSVVGRRTQRKAAMQGQ